MKPNLMSNTEVLLLVASAFASGFAWGLAVSMLTPPPARASDWSNPTDSKVEDTAPPPDEGCNPYLVIYPPDLPPSASNMNGITFKLEIGDVCGGWRSKPTVVPSIPLKPA